MAKQPNKTIIKRAQHREEFDERKLYASIFSACQAVRESERGAELIADQVTKDVLLWLEQKQEVTSHEIRLKAASFLRGYHADASYIYLHHRVIW